MCVCVCVCVCVYGLACHSVYTCFYINHRIFVLGKLLKHSKRSCNYFKSLFNFNILL